MKLFLFDSHYLNGTHKLSLPLEEPKISKSEGSWYLRIKNWLTKEENYGSEDFLTKARNILIRLKKAKERERMKTELTKETRETFPDEKRRTFERKKIELEFSKSN